LLAATGCWQSTVPEKRMWNLATAVWASASIGNVSPKISIKLCAILGQLALEPLPQELPVDKRRLRRNEIKISPESCRRLSLFGPI
jgi:hypothetical protein